MKALKYVKFIMGLVYVLCGVYFLFIPVTGNPTLSYILASAIIGYGLLRTYMGYKEISGQA